MYSLGHIIYFCLLIFGLTVEGLPRYRRQASGQFASQLGHMAGQAGQWKPGYEVYASGNNRNNYQAGGQVGVGIPIYNGGYNRPSVGIGASVGSGFGSMGGQSYRLRPNYGVGVGVNIPFGRR